MSEKKNYHTVRYGTAEGEIQFGHIHQDNNRSGVMLRSGHAFDHYLTLEADEGEEHRKSSTISVSPGSFEVKAATNEEFPDNQPGIYLDSISGDIVIRAAKGRIRLEAINIDLKATGEDGKNGNIVIDANEKVIVNAKIIDNKAKEAAKFFSEKTVEVVANNVLNMYGGFIDAADGATSIKGSKPGLFTENELNHSIKGFGLA